MSYIVFQMPPSFRDSLIEGHKFFISEARNRLLSQFNNLEEEADKASKDWLDKIGHYFDPDRDDPSGYYESAYHVGVDYYLLLSGLRDSTRLSVVAGMFHEWEKQLRSWLNQELRRIVHGVHASSKIWSADFTQMTELLRCLGFDFVDTPHHRTLDACRLVVNVYKHGDGGSLQDLKKNFPEYLTDPFKDSGDTFFRDLTDHTNLVVSDSQLNEFSDAIVEFWKRVPGNITEDDIEFLPTWLDKAIKKDRDAHSKHLNRTAP